MEVKIYYRTVDKKHTFTGKKIEPPNIHSGMTVSQLIDFFASTGYNARRLAEAAEIIKDMIDTHSTICLTLSGAMTPIGLGKSIGTMIENGFIDWIVATGANVYHDMHFAYGLPVRQGHFEVDDDILYSKQIVRIYDVYIKEIETLQTQDYIVQNEIKKKSNEIPTNVILDVAESAAILWKSKRSGGIELGGGVPKNFFQQTGPALYQILKIKEGGHDYLIQLTDARPDTGGLSGATLQEGKSWGKIRTAHAGNVIVYGDSSVYFPILCSYALSNCKARRKKEIFTKKNIWTNELKDLYLKKKRP